MLLFWCHGILKLNSGGPIRSIFDNGRAVAAPETLRRNNAPLKVVKMGFRPLLDFLKYPNLQFYTVALAHPGAAC